MYWWKPASENFRNGSSNVIIGRRIVTTSSVISLAERLRTLCMLLRVVHSYITSYEKPAHIHYHTTRCAVVSNIVLGQIPALRLFA